jgi:D-3-phosphoglycerate dehydrogenase / 2-oxoglutarate reductase
MVRWVIVFDFPSSTFYTSYLIFIFRLNGIIESIPNHMTTILLSAPYMLPYLERFRPVFTAHGLDLIVPTVHERLSEAELLAYAGQFDGAVCGDDRFTARVLEACLPRLKVISKWGTGIDSIDCQAAARLGIQVRNTPNAFSIPVADSVLGYILTFARRLIGLDRAMKTGQWNKIPGRSLSECTLGVVGVGNVGKTVLRRARAFGIRLLGNDILPISPAFVEEVGVEMTTLTDLLDRSDFISLNCDLNPTSYHLINSQTLGWVKPGAVLINTARGPIIDEPALIAALQSGTLAGAALDVFEVEPLPVDSPLLQMEQVLLAPHNANSSPAAWERVHWNTIHNLFEGLGIPHPDLLAQISSQGTQK